MNPDSPSPPRRTARLLAPGSDRMTGALLALGVLSFLAALLAIGVTLGAHAAADWGGRLQGAATVVVRGAGLESADAAAARAAEALTGLNGVSHAWVLEPDPADAVIAGLAAGRLPSIEGPTARLVAVSLSAPATAAGLRARLRAEGISATVDDHRPASSRLWRGAGLALLCVFGAWMVVMLSAYALLRLAARRCLASQRTVVSLLHLAGASDGFIISLLRARLGVRAAWAAFGGVGAAAVSVAAWRLAAHPAIAWSDLAAALPWPFVAVATALVAATLSTRAVLKPSP